MQKIKQSMILCVGESSREYFLKKLQTIQKKFIDAYKTVVVWQH